MTHLMTRKYLITMTTQNTYYTPHNEYTATRATLYEARQLCTLTGKGY